MIALRLSLAVAFATAAGVAVGALPLSGIAVVWGIGYAASCQRRDLIAQGRL